MSTKFFYFFPKIFATTFDVAVVVNTSHQLMNGAREKGLAQKKKEKREREKERKREREREREREGERERGRERERERKRERERERESVHWFFSFRITFSRTCLS